MGRPVPPDRWDPSARAVQPVRKAPLDQRDLPAPQDLLAPRGPPALLVQPALLARMRRRSAFYGGIAPAKPPALTWEPIQRDWPSMAPACGWRTPPITP